MRVELALLADYVSTTADGKLIIVGVFDSLLVPSFPRAHPSMGLALRVRLDPGDNARPGLQIRFIGPDAEPVVPPLGADVELVDWDGERSAAIQVALNMGNVTFQKAGPHRIDIYLDGRYEESVNVEVGLARPQTRDGASFSGPHE